jgi:hypothetical protein
MGDFKIPPLSTLIGSTSPNYFRVLRTGKVDPKYYHKVFLTFLVGLVSNAFIPWERLRERYRKVEVKEPVFIIGHWRSGTTLLHNLMCQDPYASFITTYQSIFPHNMYSKWLFKSFLHWQIPDKRPSDNVDLGANLPQEDDFAMANIVPAFYDFFFFPDQYRKNYERHVRFSSETDRYRSEWLRAYDYLIRKGLVNRPGKFSVLKNPANTGRFEALLKQYPEARFIHIHRNPVMVYLSTKKFFLSLFPSVQLQPTTEAQIVNIVFEYYALLMRDYLEKKDKIPAEQFFEIRFDDFEQDPFPILTKVYEKFNIAHWPEAEEAMKAYYKGLHGYQKNVYRISRAELDRVQKEWAFAFEAFDYDLPKNLEIIDN